MPLVPVLHLPAPARQALRRGLPRRVTRLVPCRALDRVEALLRQELVDAVVVNVDLTAPERLFAFARRFPRIPLFAWGTFRPDEGPLVVACHQAGLQGVFIDGVDDPVAGELLARRTASAERRRELADAPRLLRLIEPIQLETWAEVMRHAGASLTTAALADALGHSREHLSREFAAGGAPNLKRVIDLARVTCAADLLANPGYHVNEVARILGFSSASHMAGSCRRIAGVVPGDLAALGPRGVFRRFLRGRTRSRI